MAKSSENEKIKPVTANKNVSLEDRRKALEAAKLHLTKQFGEGTLITLGSHANAAGIEVIPSGSILLDEALGIGGYPRGRIIEIYGPESSGKTTLALHAIAEAQKAGGIAAFIDAEHALDPIYAKNLGVNIDELEVSQPSNGEQALEIAESLVRSGAVDVIVVDSVAALTPQAEIDGDMGDAHVGLQARLMSQALRKLTAIIGKSRTVLIFINQIRMKIGVMFGNPETTTGGNALKFYSSVRLDVRKQETLEKGEADAFGNRVKVKVVKNKVAPPFRKADLEILFGKGISATASLLDAALKYELIEKRGAWFAYNKETVGQGREGMKEFIDKNPLFEQELQEKLRKIMFPAAEAAAEAAATAKADAANAAAGAKTGGKASAKSAPPSVEAAPSVEGAPSVEAEAPDEPAAPDEPDAAAPAPAAPAAGKAAPADTAPTAADETSADTSGAEPAGAEAAAPRRGRPPKKDTGLF
ncbi:MAG: recombinase RecA [Spirochaetaceae bacterium]|jgi:recombination protein RecA|nr:recombinase RecA [Spirochaetaceae bacterium]